jgi:DNA-binding transcriptional ArsR family regulator
MNDSIRDLANIDRVIHEPARLMIVATLEGVGEADFLYLQRECGLTQGNLSSHLSKLEAAGYVEVEKTFKGKYPLTICRLTPAGRVAYESYSQQIADVLKPRP